MKTWLQNAYRTRNTSQALEWRCYYNIRPHPTPDNAQVLIFAMKGNEYLLIADQFSKFPSTRHLHSTTSTAVVIQLKLLFEERDVPEIVYSDNGPQYTSDEFTSFSKKYNFKHITSSPDYPNPMGENGGRMQKVVDESQRIRNRLSPGNDFLQSNTYLKSPAELLNGRPQTAARRQTHWRLLAAK